MGVGMVARWCLMMRWLMPGWNCRTVKESMWIVLDAYMRIASSILEDKQCSVTNSAGRYRNVACTDACAPYGGVAEGQWIVGRGSE